MPSHLYLTNGETGCLKFPFRTTPSNRRLGKQSSFQEILWSSSLPTFTLNKYFQSINSYHYLFELIVSYPDHKDPFCSRMQTLKNIYTCRCHSSKVTNSYPLTSSLPILIWIKLASKPIYIFGPLDFLMNKVFHVCISFCRSSKT